MALAKNIFIVFLAVTAAALTEAIDAANHEVQQSDKGELSKGIPDLFPCKGPSLYSLEKSNTKMRCGGRLCLVHCKPGYRSFKKIPFVYVCHGDGFWTSIPFNKGIEGYTIDWPYCFDDQDLQPLISQV